MDHSYVRNTLPSEGKSKRITNYCCVPQCSTYVTEGIRTHHFPKAAGLRRRWEVALKMGKPATDSMRVCSKHFLPKDYFPNGKKIHRLFPQAIPSQNLPLRSHDKVDTSPVKHRNAARSERVQERHQRERSGNIHEDNDSDPHEGEVVQEPAEPIVLRGFIDKACQSNLADNRSSFLPHEEGRSMADFISDGTLDKATQVNLRVRSKSLSEDSSSLPPPSDNHSTKKRAVTLPDLLSSDEKLFSFTGIHSLDLLNELVECLKDLEGEEPTNKKILSLRDRIILTMVKMKLNMSFSSIAVLLNISRQSCSNYFKNMCPLLAKVLRVMMPWPDQEDIRSNLPLSFKNYRFTRIVLDCAETTIEKCKCLKCRVLTYSQYKKNHTAKFNIGIAPSGLITEISHSYGGRASDKLIVNESGILDKLDYSDGVMVDKGYRIENECLERNLRLVRPPFLTKKQQLSREDALQTAEIARARVHVERVIQRLREYDLLRGPIPWPLAPYFDDCLTIVGGITNLGPPIMNIDKFM